MRSTSPEPVRTVVTVISLRVSVPVLSVQITEAEPSVSTDDSFLTMARSRAMRCTPSASTTDRMAGSPSGTAATASDTPTSSTSTRSSVVSTSEVSRMAPTTTTAMTTTATPSVRPIRSTSRCRGVRSSSVWPSSRATWPISVPMPVAVTTARPRPLATAVPLKAMSKRSPRATSSGRVATSLSTGSLSPVSDASATLSARASTSRASAATASPSASTSTSPGTTSVAGTRRTSPSRTTPACAAAIRARAATACSARASWA